MRVNNNFCFVEDLSSNIKFTDDDFIDQKEKLNLKENFNITTFTQINNKKYYNIKAVLTAGVFSSYGNNNLFFSRVYDLDKKIDDTIYFNDNEISQNKIDVSVNVKIFKRTYGVSSSEEFDDIYITPFVDRTNLELRENSFGDDFYPNYYNAYSALDLSNSISVLGRSEELLGKILSENNTKDVKVDLGFSRDARSRNVTVADADLSEYNYQKSGYTLIQNNVEPYLDYEEVFDEDLTTRKTNFYYENVYVNGKNIQVLKFEKGEGINDSDISRNISYFLDDENLVIPFNDSKEESTIIYTTASGFYTDNSYNVSKESIGFIGEID